MQNSAVNNSMSNTPLNYFSRSLNEKIMLVQVLVAIFLSMNCLMIFTFLKKEMFREDTRYILFGQTLFVDSAVMLLTDILLIGSYYQYPIHMIPCVAACTVLNLLTICTPLTLVAMCLERYVAICMPLRHASISTSRTRFFGLLFIWGISFVLPLFSIIAYFSVAPPGAVFSYVVCSVELMLAEQWHAYTRVAILQILFFFMIVTIVFTYIKIMIAARSVSLDNRKSMTKSLKTVILHAFQLFLCLIQFLTPYVEMAYWKIDIMVFINVRYSNFVVFIIAPRCLSPMIYGLRDKMFSLVLRQNVMCGFDNIFPKLFSQWKRQRKINISLKHFNVQNTCVTSSINMVSVYSVYAITE